MVSIIIPCYNASSWISKTIDSCLEQEKFVSEIIVVDDFSTDSSWQLISGYQQRYPGLIRAEKNRSKGGNNARNLGFDLSKGEYIQWLDADDLLVAGKFHKQLDLFRECEGADIVYSDWQLDTYNDSGAKILTEYKYHKAYNDFLFELLMDNWSPPHNYLIKRGFAARLRNLNAWNPSTPVFQDREYFTMAAIHGANFRYAPGLFSVYNRWNKNSVSQDKEKKKTVLLSLFSEFREQIGKNERFDNREKAFYGKVIHTLELLTNISSGRWAIRGKGLSFKNVHWPVLDYKARLKVAMVLVLNKLFPGSDRK